MVMTEERFQRALQEVIMTPPASCNPSAQVETHTVMHHKHTLMFILGMKSFLRFYSNVAVVAHDDGTLTQQDKQLLQEHIQGIRIIESAEGQALVEQALQDKPNILKNNLTFPNTRQLFDYALSSKNPKLISFDSDLLFVEKPDQIVEWIEGDSPTILYNREKDPFNPYPHLSKRYRILPDFNIGLTCYYKDVIDWDQVDELLGMMPQFSWVSGQIVLAIMLASSKHYRSVPLDREKYQIRRDSEENSFFFNESEYKKGLHKCPWTCRHYLRSGGLTLEYFIDARRIIKELRT